MPQILESSLDEKLLSSPILATTSLDMDHRQTAPTAAGPTGWQLCSMIFSVAVGFAGFATSIAAAVSAIGLTETDLTQKPALVWTIFALMFCSTALMFNETSRALQVRPARLPAGIRSVLPGGWLASQYGAFVIAVHYCLNILDNRQPTGLDSKDIERIARCCC